MITESTRRSVYDRSNGNCQNPLCDEIHAYRSISETIEYPFLTTFEMHHIYPKSQYQGVDRDHSWNLALLCRECHKDTDRSVHSGNGLLREALEIAADNRKPIHEREGGKHPDLIRAKVRRQKFYKSQINKFKASHGGQTPWQFRYQQHKKV